MADNFNEKIGFIWGVADLLRGDYKQSEYGRVILPLFVLRRLDQVLAPTRAAVWAEADKKSRAAEEIRKRRLRAASGQSFYNLSKLDLQKILADPDNVADNLRDYIRGFSQDVQDIMERFRFEAQLRRLDKAGLLYLVLQRFCQIDLHPYQLGPDGAPRLGPDGRPLDNVSNHQMGSIFEELIRKFSEQSNETAGEHFTPREVIRLMVSLLFQEDDAALSKSGVVRTIYDPACGTGGMLSVAEEQLSRLNSQARLLVYGQELNDESYAICKADMLVKGEDTTRLVCGNSFSEDGLPELRADYLISNPPFGVDWSKAQAVVRAEHDSRGHSGRFGPGLPRKNDGSLLFLLHMLSKMKPVKKNKSGALEGGSRLAIVFNGSPLFTGAAGSGESEIRRWILENDWLEAIIALPDQMFYNTGISTYIWLLSNRKSKARQGKVQLINGVNYFQKMKKSLGDKRKELSPEHIAQLVTLHAELDPEHPDVLLFSNTDFGFYRVTVERPLRLNFQPSPERIARLPEQSAWAKLSHPTKKGAAGEAQRAEGLALEQAILDALAGMEPRLYRSRPAFLAALKEATEAAGLKLPAPVKKAVLAALSERDPEAEVCTLKGAPEPDPQLRDYENIPLSESIEAYMAREVLPHVPDAWVDEDKTKIGYEIPFTRHFYVYEPPRPLEVIEAEIRELEAELQGLMGEVLG